MMPILDGPMDWLSILDSDPDRAEARYRDLRRQLVRFLEWRNCPEPEDAAQEALARGFKRIAGGTDTSVSGVRSYFFGIAKNLVKEGWKPRREELLDPTGWEQAVSPERHVEQVEARLALVQYLRRLNRSERTLLVRYYTEDRTVLCHELGVTPANLRVTVHRIRRKIEDVRRADTTNVRGSASG
jgi:RNA polymerase sigma factor (sigma-70 family)